MSDFYGIVLVAGLIFGIISAVIASKRGLEPVGYFFGGAFLGPIGILIAVLARNSLQESEQKIKSEDFMKCPACAEAIRSEAVKCRYCGEHVIPKRAHAPHFTSPYHARRYLEGNGYAVSGGSISPSFKVTSPSGKKLFLKSPAAVVDLANSVYKEE